MSSKFTGNLLWNRDWKSIKVTRSIVKDGKLVQWTMLWSAFILIDTIYN